MKAGQGRGSWMALQGQDGNMTALPESQATSGKNHDWLRASNLATKSGQ